MRYEGSGSGIKKFPTCGCNHAVIEAALQLTLENDLHPPRIVRAIARISPYMNRLVGAPYDPDDNPEVAAQFSAQYGIACAVSRRKVGLGELEASSALDPGLRELASRVFIEIDASNAGQLVPAEVELVLDDGTRLTRRISALPGSPENPMTPADEAEKNRDCLARGVSPLSQEAIDRLIARIADIEALDDVALLFDPADEVRR